MRRRRSGRGGRVGAPPSPPGAARSNGCGSRVPVGAPAPGPGIQIRTVMREGRMEPEATHQTILVYDIQGSSRLDNAQKHAMRRRLDEARDGAARAAGIPAAAIHGFDRGDGALVLVDGAIPKTTV